MMKYDTWGKYENDENYMQKVRIHWRMMGSEALESHDSYNFHVPCCDVDREAMTLKNQ